MRETKSSIQIKPHVFISSLNISTHQEYAADMLTCAIMPSSPCLCEPFIFTVVLVLADVHFTVQWCAPVVSPLMVVRSAPGKVFREMNHNNNASNDNDMIRL